MSCRIKVLCLGSWSFGRWVRRVFVSFSVGVLPTVVR